MPTTDQLDMVVHGVRNGEKQPVGVDKGGALRVSTPPERDGNKLNDVVLGATDTEVFTADKTYRKVSVLTCNNAGADVTFQLHHVMNGDSSTDTNLISTKGMTLRSDGPPLYHDQFELRAGESIRGLCSSASGVSVSIYGVAS